MQLKRKLQLKILQKLKVDYPHIVGTIEAFGEDATKSEFQANLSYLAEYGLVETSGIAGHSGHIISTRITAEGLDFLEDDGGIGAILKTLTIRFDVDNLRNIIKDGILNSTIPKQEKKSILTKLKELPADILKTLTINLVEKGLTNPELVAFIAQMLKDIT